MRPGDARIAGQVERDHGNVGMHRFHPQQNGFRLLNAFVASDSIGQTDPPASGFRINLYKVALATAAAILGLSSQIVAG